MAALNAKEIVEKIKDLSSKEARRANDEELVGPLTTVLTAIQLNRETFVKYFLNKLQTFIGKTPAIGKPSFNYHSIDAFTLSKEFESFLENSMNTKYENSIVPTKNTTINNIKYCLEACQLALSDSIGFKTGEPTFDITVVGNKQLYIGKMNAVVVDVNLRLNIKLPIYNLKGADVTTTELDTTNETPSVTTNETPSVTTNETPPVTTNETPSDIAEPSDNPLEQGGGSLRNAAKKITSAIRVITALQPNPPPTQGEPKSPDDFIKEFEKIKSNYKDYEIGFAEITGGKSVEITLDDTNLNIKGQYHPFYRKTDGTVSWELPKSGGSSKKTRHRRRRRRRATRRW